MNTTCITPHARISCAAWSASTRPPLRTVARSRSRRRSPRDASSRAASPKSRRTLIMAAALGGTLVIGGGFAGGYVARLLGKRGATIVSPENFMLYTPLLPEAASGTLEPRHVVVPLRMMCPHGELLLGRATELDVASRSAQVSTDDGLVTLEYENVVVALGAISRTLPIPGLADHALGFKSLADAIFLRNHVLRRLEAAVAAQSEAHRRRELTFVFVGAGGAGGPRSSSAARGPPGARRGRSCRPSCATHCATPPRCGASRSTGCSSTQ